MIKYHEEIQEEGRHLPFFFTNEVTLIKENNQQSKLQLRNTDAKS